MSDDDSPTESPALSPPPPRNLDGVDLRTDAYYAERLLVDVLRLSKKWLRTHVAAFAGGVRRIYRGGDVLAALTFFPSVSATTRHHARLRAERVSPTQTGSRDEFAGQQTPALTRRSGPPGSRFDVRGLPKQRRTRRA